MGRCFPCLLSIGFLLLVYFSCFASSPISAGFFGKGYYSLIQTSLVKILKRFAFPYIQGNYGILA
jgi:hypothetical protein